MAAVMLGGPMLPAFGWPITARKSGVSRSAASSSSVRSSLLSCSAVASASVISLAGALRLPDSMSRTADAATPESRASCSMLTPRRLR